MKNSFKAVICVLSLAGAFGLVSGIATMADARSVDAPSSVQAPVITLPEVVITGQAPIVLGEMVISASPSPKAAHKVKQGRGMVVRSHDLRQGGSPNATSVVYWDSGR